MKIIDCIQGSPEWFACRAGIPTASQFNKIVTTTGEISRSMRELALHLASQVIVTELEEPFTSIAMERGIELEHEAVEKYQVQTLNPVEKVGFMVGNNYGYSPDGLIGDNGLLEVKCPLQKNHAKYLAAKKVPSDYKAQVQGGLLVSDRDWCDFVSYNPTFVPEYQLLIVREYRDEQYIRALSKGIKKCIEVRNEFLEKLKNKEK
mgnify:FL=1